MKYKTKTIVTMILAFSLLIGSTLIFPDAAAKNAFAATKAVKTLTLKKSKVTILWGDMKFISFRIKADKGVSKKISTKSSNKKVAKVVYSDSKEIGIYGNKPGKATITVTTKAKNAKGKKLSKKIKVTVKGYSSGEATPAANSPTTADSSSVNKIVDYEANKKSIMDYIIQKGEMYKDGGYMYYYGPSSASSLNDGATTDGQYILTYMYNKVRITLYPGSKKMQAVSFNDNNTFGYTEVSDYSLLTGTPSDETLFNWGDSISDLAGITWRGTTFATKVSATAAIITTLKKANNSTYFNSFSLKELGFTSFIY